MLHPLLNSELKEQLIVLEERFISSLWTEQTFRELQRIYAQLIAYYDQLEDPIRDYFLEKNSYINLKRSEVQKTFLDELSVSRPTSDVPEIDVCLGTHKQLRFKKLQLAKQVEGLRLADLEGSIDRILKMHHDEENRYAEFIKKEQLSQEQSFQIRLSELRERRAEATLNDLSCTIGSVAEHLRRRTSGKERGRAQSSTGNRILNFSANYSESGDERSSDQREDSHSETKE